MFGAIIGDIVGSRFEWNNHKSKDFLLFTNTCRVTDDSIMTLAVAKAIMEAQKNKGTLQNDSFIENITVKYLQEIGRNYPRCGYGRSFFQWIFSDCPKPYNSFGNGAAMRISPVGFIARTESEAIQLAKAVTSVSHNHAEGIKGAEAVAVAIFMARCGLTKSQIHNRINGSYYPLNFTIDAIRDTYPGNATCQNTVPQAIEAFLESNSFEDAIRIAISLGGDSDTLATMTGSIAEAYYGIPEDIKEQALPYLDPDLRAIYDEWMQFSSKTLLPSF